MTKEAATKLVTLLNEASGLLDSSVAVVVAAQEPESVLTDYRRTIGRIMSSIYLDMLAPLYARFPDLAPVGLGPEDPPR